MEIRPATLYDLPEILRVYEYARSFMAQHGNAGQWAGGYPAKELIEDDIRRGKLYVCLAAGAIAGVFYFAQEDDPTYRVLEEGAWRSDAPYAVVHRIASARGTRGVATFCLNWAFERSGNLRIDTHTDNAPMRNLLAKLGFAYCGRIRLADGSPRIAFQKVK